jgi:hypothetical protein
MCGPEPAENIDEQLKPVLETNQARVVIDFTVGPAGVGPVTSVTPAGVRNDPPVPPPNE